MNSFFDVSRTAALIGIGAVKKLAESRAAVFGAGGVGGYVCEALARAGVGHITVIDGDSVAPSNLNRQIIAVQSTIGRPKAEVMKERILSVNPDCDVTALDLFYLPENAGLVDFGGFDAVADCVDTVSAKIEIAIRSKAAGVPVISSMGAGNRLYPERFRVCDLFETKTDPLARVMRREMRARGVSSLTVCWSDETPLSPVTEKDPASGKYPPGSVSFVPSAAGLVIAGWMVRTLAGIE